MAQTINLDDYKKMQLGDRQLYIDEKNGFVVAEKIYNRYWVYYAAASNIRVVEEGDTIRIIVDS